MTVSGKFEQGELDQMVEETILYKALSKQCTESNLQPPTPSNADHCISPEASTLSDGSTFQGESVAVLEPPLDECSRLLQIWGWVASHDDLGAGVDGRHCQPTRVPARVDRGVTSKGEDVVREGVKFGEGDGDMREQGHLGEGLHASISRAGKKNRSLEY